MLQKKVAGCITRVDVSRVRNLYYSLPSCLHGFSMGLYGFAGESFEQQNNTLRSVEKLQFAIKAFNLAST